MVIFYINGNLNCGLCAGLPVCTDYSASPHLFFFYIHICMCAYTWKKASYIVLRAGTVGPTRLRGSVSDEWQVKRQGQDLRINPYTALFLPQKNG